MRAQTYFAVLLTAAVACRPSNTAAADTSANARQAIDAANSQWPRLTSTGHADSIADFYTDDAVLMPPNMATIRGKEGIRAFFAEINKMNPQPTLTLRAENVVANGPVAVETGRWHWQNHPGAQLPPGMPPADSGKYIVRWAQQNGKWVMVDDIWNSDLPIPQPAAPAPPPARRRS